jgi:putative transposase
MDSDRVFFITTVTAQRQPIFRRDTTANLLIEILAHYRDQQRFLLHEFVVMLDHLHLLITPAENISLERVMQFIKGGFAFRYAHGPIWQASFTNHRVHDLEDYETHYEYIRLNPVRARLARTPESYPYSSALARTPESYPYSSASERLRLDPVRQGLKPRVVEALTRR